MTSPRKKRAQQPEHVSPIQLKSEGFEYQFVKKGSIVFVVEALGRIKTGFRFKT